MAGKLKGSVRLGGKSALDEALEKGAKESAAALKAIPDKEMYEVEVGYDYEEPGRSLIVLDRSSGGNLSDDVMRIIGVDEDDLTDDEKDPEALYELAEDFVKEVNKNLEGDYLTIDDNSFVYFRPSEQHDDDKQKRRDILAPTGDQADELRRMMREKEGLDKPISQRDQSEKEEGK
jgi:hypothetical protein